MNNGIAKHYDDETGRTLLVVDEAEYSVMSHEQLSAIQDAKRRKAAMETVGGGRNYVVAYHVPVRKLNDILSLNEIGAVMKLIPYMRFDRNGELRYAAKRMGIEEIARAIGKARRWTVTLVSGLVTAGVLIAEKDGKRNVYNVSEAYHTIGRAIKGTTFTRIYQTKTRTDIAKVSIQAAGFLYKMIPYIHYEYMYLCCNPNVRHSDEIRHLSQARFASEVGVDDETASRCMRELIVAGFVMRSEAFGAKIIRMNPDVMYRKKPRAENDEYTEFVRNEFKQALRAEECGDKGVVEVDDAAYPY
ncbi:hypothetical protein BBD42_15555 [Paenibacillus sp. BIHB 4019]|uniref:Uncharacterized protein n=1 Tax=Paenibacillus sp. BIHB 4019 TaxID=1870819 RepID=A0A1B2DJ48_9BACL|nr:hypothetical protein [Paenibacillus sp. BIHB 4019]ANY67723.1 hypothetical protein BBD42_15555 [Paenibacillus sp. BIHB 4019]